MNNSSDMEEFMKSISEVLDDLENINYSLNYQDNPIKYHKKIPKNKSNGLPPLHPNIPSFYKNQNSTSKLINIQGIAFLKKIK